MLYPLKFEPILKSKIWGGQKLSSQYNKVAIDLPNIGESWEISGVSSDVSVVSDGFLKENALDELIEIYMGDLVGDKVYERFGNEFPLLIKFIDANDDLSIQVHPNDELAKQRHNSYGKTEMWYVMQADKGSKLISGFNKVIDQEIYLMHLNNGTLSEILSYHEVTPGDVFFMPAGRVHAIGAGMLIAEIQQTSDVTYRIFDFNRLDDKGEPRELHTDLALDAINFSDADSASVEYQSIENELVETVACPYFTTNFIELTKPIEKDYIDLDSFVIYMCLEGDVIIDYGQKDKVAICKGETVLIPAELKNIFLSPIGDAKLLEVYVK